MPSRSQRSIDALIDAFPQSQHPEHRAASRMLLYPDWSQRVSSAGHVSEESIPLHVPGTGIGRRRGRPDHRAQTYQVTAGHRRRVVRPQPYPHLVVERRLAAVQPDRGYGEPTPRRQFLHAADSSVHNGGLPWQSVHWPRHGRGKLRRGKADGGSADRQGHATQDGFGAQAGRCDDSRTSNRDANPRRRLVTQREVQQDAHAHEHRQPQSKAPTFGRPPGLQPCGNPLHAGQAIASASTAGE
jgi:hypothetical protein